MSYEGWRSIKLREIVDTISETHKLDKRSIVLINTSDVFNGKVLNHTYTENKNLRGQFKKSFKKGDILYSEIRPQNKRFAVVDFTSDDYVASTKLMVLRKKSDIVDLEFLFQMLKSDNIINKLQIIAESRSGTFPQITYNELANLEIILPTLFEQKFIAEFLKLLDDKIELNNQFNKTLEEMAQAIFKHWFIDFEFPVENGQPYKSSGGEMVDSEMGLIPKKWKVRELGELVETINGYSYSGVDLKESNNAMMTIKNFNRNGGIKIDGFKEIEITKKVKTSHHIHLFDVLVACTDLTQKAEIIGNPVLLLTKSKYKNVIASMDLVKIKIKETAVSSFFIYNLMKDNRFKDFALGYTTGTTVLHLNKMAIPQYKVALPYEGKYFEHFTAIVEPLYKLVSENINETRILTAIRDSLLPKLMSGEIRVPIENEVS